MTDSILFSLDGRDEFAQAIIKEVQVWTSDGEVHLGLLNRDQFSDNELCVDFLESVRGKRVYLVSSPRSSDSIIELLWSIDAAKRNAAREIIVVLPYYPYARQDKKDQARGPIGAKIMAEMIEQRGATSVITFDLHADQIQGFFNIPVIHIEGKNVYDNYIAGLVGDNADDYLLCGPDAGSGKRVKRMKNQLASHHDLDLNYVMMDKTRKKANEVDTMIIIGDVHGKHVIILDDLVDTGGTLCKAAQVLLDAGALSVRAIITHGVLSGKAYTNISNSSLTELVISDSIPSQPNDKIRVISVTTQIGLAIDAINSSQSYDALKEF